METYDETPVEPERPYPMNRRSRLEIVPVEDPATPKLTDPRLLSVVRIVHLSDTHNMHNDETKIPPLPQADILIHTGDFTNRGRREEIEDFNEYLGCQRQCPCKIVIIGNHDVRDPDLTNVQIRDLLSNATHVPLYETVTVLGLRFYGMPWQRMHTWDYRLQASRSWNFAIDGDRLDNIPNNGFDFLLTHGPLFGQFDSAENFLTPSGSTTIRDRVANLRPPPLAHFFGHIHESYGMTPMADATEGVLFVNGACSPHAKRHQGNKSEWTPWRLFEVRIWREVEPEEEEEGGES